MDNEQITYEQTADTTVDSVSNEATDNQTVDTHEADSTVQAEMGNEADAPVQNTDDSIDEDTVKIGDKEYTPSQIAELVKRSEMASEEKPQIREITSIQQDYARIADSQKSDYVALFKRYMARAVAPEVEIINNGKKEIVQDTDAILTAVKNGINTGDFTQFIQHLSPIDVQNFINERGQLEEYYAPQIETIAQEYQNVTDIQAKQEDITRWESFIEANAKDKPSEKYILNYFKDKYNFDEGQQKEFLQKFREAKALDANSKVLDSDTEEIKKAMMNSSVAGTPPAGKQKIFTRKQIDAMSIEEFAKNEKIIFEQAAKGLIK